MKLCLIILVVAIAAIDHSQARPPLRQFVPRSRAYGINRDGYGHQRPSKGKEFIKSIIEIPKGIAIGIRRIAGGLVAAKGGWVSGQGAYINSPSLIAKGDRIVELGKIVAGPGPYGPEAPSPPF